ncbi:hypothetical protein ACFLZV_07375, partial [Candidatus Margulisiibacteriota bacterium]
MNWDGTITNNFNAILLPTLNTGLGWDLNNLYVNGTIKVINSPGSLSGLALWMAADDRGAVSVTGNNKVRNMIDKSGNGVNLFQTVDDNRPLYQLNSQNGKAAIRLDAVNDYLIGGSNYIFSSSDGLCVFAVVKSDPEKSGKAFIYDIGFHGERGYGYTFCNNFISGYTPQQYSGAYHETSVSYSSSKYYVTAYNIKFNSTQKYFINQEEKMSASISGLNQLTTSEIDESSTRGLYSGPITIGSQAKGHLDGDRYYDGEIAELLVFTRYITDSERETIEEYLASKWDVDDDTSDTGDDFPFDDKLQETPAKSDSLPVTADLTLWLDGSEPHGVSTSVTLTTSNTALQTWIDYSGQNNHAVQIDTSVQPKYNENILNSKSVVYFTGNQRLHLYPVLDISDWTILVVTTFPKGALGGSGSWNTFTRGYSYDHQLIVDNSTLKLGTFDNYTGGGFYDSGVSTAAFSGGKLIEVVGNGSATTFYVDGVLGGSVGFKSASDIYTIGNYNTGTQPFGEVAELIVYDSALSTSDRQELELYLGEKWNLDIDGDGVPHDKDHYPTDNTKVIDLPSELDIGNLMLWLDASATKNGVPILEKDGSNYVSNWYDLSGQSNHASQASSSLQPVLATNSINSKSVITFDGTDVIAIDYPSALGLQNSDYEVFFVAQTQSTATQFLMAGTSEMYEMHINGDAGFRFIPDGHPAHYSDVGATSQYLNIPYIYSARVTADVGIARVNLTDGSSSASGARSADNASPIILGRRTSGTGPLFGDIAEVIIFNRAVSSTEREAVEKYLARKWDIDGDGADETDVFPFDPKLEKVPAKSDSLPVTQNLA